jgi:hypothetical protein
LSNLSHGARGPRHLAFEMDDIIKRFRKLVERMTEWKLQDIKGSYDIIISLGSWCGPSLNLITLD